MLRDTRLCSACRANLDAQRRGQRPLWPERL
jgi:hypothetical protein